MKQRSYTYNHLFHANDYEGADGSFPNGVNVLYGEPDMVTDYDYGSGTPGPVIRTVETDYLAFQNPSALAQNLLDRPSKIVVTDGVTGNKTSRHMGMMSGAW